MCLPMINHYRDVDLIPLTEEKLLVIACDSCGAIGDKELDQVKISPYYVGQSTARVVIMEIMSVGANPVALTAAICNENQPTGEQILEGIREELAQAGFSQIPITISTEKNMVTQQTGLGISVVAICEKENLRIGKSQIGDIVYVVGVPKVGDEVVQDQGKIADCRVLRQILNIQGVRDIIPVGSQGIVGECRKLATYLGGQFQRLSPLDINIEKSAGPCTTIVFTDPYEIDLQGKVEVPYFCVGKIM